MHIHSEILKFVDETLSFSVLTQSRFIELDHDADVWSTVLRFSTDRNLRLSETVGMENAQSSIMH